MSDYIPLKDKAYSYLKQLIASGELQPGKIYSETKLAAEINISRTPFKEALVRLSQDRYIDILPSKGFQIHVMDKKDIYSTYQMRTAIEGFCALNLARSKTMPRGEEALKRMAESIEQMEKMVAAHAKPEDYLPVDLAFHHAMVWSAENDEMSALFDSLNYRVSIIALDSLAQIGRPCEALAEHKAIYNSIAMSGHDLDIDAYTTVMRHMEHARDITIKHVE